MIRSSGLLNHVKACQQFDPASFRPFFVGGKKVGAVRSSLNDVRVHLEGFVWGEAGLSLSLQPDTETTRTAALARAATELSSLHDTPLHGEIYPVFAAWGDPVLAHIDRAAIPWFGVKGCGVHVNGIVRKPEGLFFWIGERSATCRVDPGKLDLMIGGGLPLGLTIEENLCKEAWEEAGMPSELARQARLVSTLSYKLEMMGGLRNDTLFVHDLELSESYTPHNTDGEVAAFHLMPATEITQIIRTTDRFKFNCNLVLIDRLLAHNIITPEDGEYAALMDEMSRVRE